MLEVKGVAKAYGQAGGRSTLAIQEVSLQVEGGQFVSIVGPSGCGKSTLLMCIAGLTRPSRGVVLLNGQEVTGPPPGLILVFQEYNKSLFAWRTVFGNVAFGLEVRPDYSPAMREKAGYLLNVVGLEGFEGHYPWELSGGMQQRVAIARALAHEPDVLAMDEPFGSVDALTRLELEDTLLGLWEKLGTTILFVTHDIEEAIYLSDKVYVLSRRPAMVVKEIQVDLERPRDQLTTREDPRFIKHRHDIFEEIYTEMRRARAPNESHPQGN